MLKSLHRNDTQTIPYIATKNWDLSNVANEDLILMEHSGSDGLPVAIEYLDYGPIHILVSYGCNLAKEQQDLDKVVPRSGLKTTGIFYPESDPTNPDGTFQRVVYAQIVATFYNRYHDPTKIWGLEEIDFERSQTKRFVADKFKLLDVPQKVFGEKVLENTVTLYDTTTDNDYIITDDGHCNLFAGTNLFSHQQEIRHFKNEFAIGFDYFCDGYNNNTGSPGGDINLTASLWATPVLTASLYAGSQSLVTWSYELTNNDFFLLQRSVDSGTTWPNNYLLPSSSLQYIDAGVSSFNTYWYRVAAASYYGIGLFSNTGSVYIPGVPPLPPINLIVTSGSSILNWTIGSIDTDYYHIEKSIDPTGSGYFYFGTSSTTTDTDIDVTSSLNGTPYWYQVAAVNEWGTSSFSNTASIIFARAHISAPFLSVISGSAILNWTEVSPVDYFAIEKSIDPTGSGYFFFTTSVALTYTDIDVTSSYGGTPYWYRVAAVNFEETSSYSNTASITFTKPLLPPVVSNPADLTVYLGENAVFSVTASGDNDGTTPLTFGWISGSTFLSDGVHISGSYVIGVNTSSLTIFNCQFTDAGTYKVEVSSFVGTVFSNTASLTVLDNAVTFSAGDSSSFGMTLYQGSAVPQAIPDADLGPVSIGISSGSLATIIITSSAAEPTASVGYDLIGGALTTVVLMTSGSEATASVGYDLIGGVLTTVVLLTSGSETTASVGYDLIGGDLATVIITDSGADSISDAAGNATPGLNIGLYSGSLSP